MRRWQLRLVPLALLAALLGGAIGVRAEDAPPIAPFTTAHLRIDGTISAQGQVLPVQGEGEIDATRGASRLTIAVLGAAFETITVDGRTYSRSALTGRWEYSEGAQASGFNPAQLAPYDPATIRAAGRSFTRIGPEMIGGAATTRWRADADLQRLLGLGAPAASGAGLGQTAATMDLWIGEADQRLHRLAIETRASAGTPGTPAPAAGQALTLTFDNFDAPISIIAPPGAVPATPGAFGGAGAIGAPAARTPASAAPALGNTPATRAAGATGGGAPSAAPGATTSTASATIARNMGIVGLALLALLGLLTVRHRRARAAPPADGP